MRYLVSILFALPLFFSSLSLANQNQNQNSLIITGSSTWQPFSFLNKNGEPEGIMVDFWRLYGKHNNIDIQFKLLPWAQSLKYASDNYNAIHGGLGFTQTRAKNLLFSQQLPLAQYQVSLFVRKGLQLDLINKLDTAVIGSVSSTVNHEFLQSRLAVEKMKLFPTFGELNQAAYKGDIDVFIDDQNSAFYHMKANDKKGEFVLQQTLYSFPLHFAINKSSQSLLPLIENGISNIPASDIKAIYQKWLPENISLWQIKMEDVRLKLTAIAVIIFLGFGLFFYNLRLKQKNAELEKKITLLSDTTTKLESIANTDALTGAKSRHQFFNELTEKRFSNLPFVVAVLEIDKLKLINDKYGQDVGDMVLKHVAKQLKWQLSDNFFARLCGGSFAILFESVDNEGAEKKLKQLQQNLKANPMHLDQQVIQMQISSGIACYPVDEKQGEALVRIATSRLRMAKISTTEVKALEFNPLDSNSLIASLSH